MSTPPRARLSAGLILVRRRSGGEVEVLLGHMGGPLWARKDTGAWTIPKGEHSPEEDAFDAARREFTEELGVGAPPDDDGYLDLGTVRQSGGKVVHAWAVAGDLDPAACVSNTFTLEWPPRSGQLREFPELDRVAWTALPRARELVVRAQAELIDRVGAAVESGQLPV